MWTCHAKEKKNNNKNDNQQRRLQETAKTPQKPKKNAAGSRRARSLSGISDHDWLSGSVLQSVKLFAVAGGKNFATLQWIFWKFGGVSDTQRHEAINITSQIQTKPEKMIISKQKIETKNIKWTCQIFFRYNINNVFKQII